MNRQRRKKWARTAAKIILALVILDVALYATADRYLGKIIANEEDQFTRVRLEWWRERASLSRLEKRAAVLPAEEQEMQAFLDKHIPPRREAFSRAAVLIQKLTQESQVQLAAIKYNPVKIQGEPFDHLGLETSVQGSFTNLLSFAHALETSSDFIMVRSFKFAAGDGGVLALRVNADLYLLP